jgi:hypothetical protein
MALVLTGASLGPLWVSLVVLMLPILIVFAPQAVRRDKRTIATLLVAVAFVVGVPVYAVICNVCALCKTEWWFLYVECWFL